LFAKRPAPGRVKTRVALKLGDAAAVALAQALLADSVSALRGIHVGRRVIATVGELSWVREHDVEAWDQGDGDLGQRVERILRRGCEEQGAAIAVGADTAGLRAADLDDAVRRLAHADAVLGRAEDGGFWCLGVRRCPPGWLTPVRWSAATTADDVEAALRALGVRAAPLPVRRDVDTVADLLRPGLDPGPALSAWLTSWGPVAREADRSDG
jgi:rSAM/selenodomain-associated transferase 1